jgi:ribosome biogenesis GTPase
MPDLESFGWRPFFAEAFAPHAAEGLRPARVCVEHRGGWGVFTEDGERPARIAGRLRHAATSSADYPAVGDWVAVRPGGPDDPALIHAVLPRWSKFSRTAAGDRPEEQIVAANVDALFVLVALGPPLNRRRLERFLVFARESGAQPVVVMSKSDLHPDPGAAEEEARAVAGEVPVHAVSNFTGAGLDALRPYLAPGHTVALVGPSGVGKSSLVNACLGDEVMATEEVRESDLKGRHTTTARHLIPLPGGGLLLDTPGMRELQLWQAEEAVEETFADIEQLAARCRFADCRHATEPGCAVRAAVEAGALDPARLAHQRKLREETERAARRVPSGPAVPGRAPRWQARRHGRPPTGR